MPNGSSTLDRPDALRDSVSALNRHSKMSCPSAERRRSPTSTRL